MRVNSANDLVKSTEMFISCSIGLYSLLMSATVAVMTPTVSEVSICLMMKYPPAK